MSMIPTPGPWKWARINPTTVEIFAPWSDRVTHGLPGFADYRGIMIAQVIHHSGDGAAPRAHAEMNAAMLAAAPRLLQALRLAITEIETHRLEHGTLPGDEERLRKMRLAMAEALSAVEPELTQI